MTYVKSDRTFFICVILFLIAMATYGWNIALIMFAIIAVLYLYFLQRRMALHKAAQSVGNIFNNIFEIPPKALLKLNKITFEANSSILKKSNIIIKTLKKFGIELVYVEARRSPTVTQLLFRLPKDSLTKVNKILSHKEDLKLALQTNLINIINVVENTDCIGIEIPRQSTSKVGLLNIFNDNGFQDFIRKMNLEFPDGRFLNGLPIALGYNGMGLPLYLNATKAPHILIAGSTNSGKTSCIHAVINSLLFYHTPETLHLYLVDGKNTELSLYTGLNHLKKPIGKNFEGLNLILEEISVEVQRRNNLLNTAKKRDILSYNESVTSVKDILPFIVLIIDEFAEITMSTNRADNNFTEFQTKIIRLGQSARSAGVHLILSTQRPDKNIVTPLLKANIPTRISFQVTDKTNSMVVIDRVGAELLSGKGDGYLLYESKLTRFQGTLVDDIEIHNILDWYHKKYQLEERFKPTKQVDYSEKD